MLKPRFKALPLFLSPSLGWLLPQNYDEVFPLEDVISKFGSVWSQLHTVNLTHTHKQRSGYIILLLRQQAFLPQLAFPKLRVLPILGRINRWAAVTDGTAAKERPTLLRLRGGRTSLSVPAACPADCLRWDKLWNQHWQRWVCRVCSVCAAQGSRKLRRTCHQPHRCSSSHEHGFNITLVNQQIQRRAVTPASSL